MPQYYQDLSLGRDDNDPAEWSESHVPTLA
jgi:hypothetical protein